MEDLSDVEREAVKRGIPYPARDLDYAMSFVAKIYTELGGNIFHDKDEIARAQNLAYNSIKQTLGTCQLYGLLELKHGTGYKPTSLFISLYLPKNDDERREAIIKSITTPQMYNELIGKFEGHVLPQISGLINTIVRDYNLKREIAKKAADIFVENLRTHQLLDQRNILNLTLNKVDNKREANPPKSDFNDTPIPQLANENDIVRKNNAENDVSILDILIPLKSTNIKAHLLIPESYKEEDLERILKFVEALK